jgi:PIN domain nuclease of toxin-antitoxin system
LAEVTTNTSILIIVVAVAALLMVVALTVVVYKTRAEKRGSGLGDLSLRDAACLGEPSKRE